MIDPALLRDHPEAVRGSLATRVGDFSTEIEELATLDKVSALTPEYPGWMLERLSADRLAMIQNG